MFGRQQLCSGPEMLLQMSEQTIKRKGLDYLAWIWLYLPIVLFILY